MQEFRSNIWYRVAAVRPRLAPHIQVRRQRFRGRTWYTLFDPLTQRSHRLSPPAWNIVARMNGQRTVDELWSHSAETLGAEAAPQHELMQLLAQLHASDALVSDAAPDLDELLERRSRQQAQLWRRNLTNPLAIRLKLIDPDAFLAATLPVFRWMFTPVGGLLWLLLTVPAGLLAWSHWEQLTHDKADQLLSASSLLTLAVVYPLVKLLHEFAHAYAAKSFGAEVRDMGVMVLVMVPVPYVDASGSAAFPDKWRRAAVAAAGMGMELLLGALALYVWLEVEPGLLRSLAFSVMLIGGLSTLVFNGNPLLRFDGYYLLCDLLEIPNLAQRSGEYWKWLTRRIAFGLQHVLAPNATPGERWWFLIYAPASLVYRVGVTFGIALFLAQEYLYVGIAIGLWGIVSLLVWPIVKGLHYVAASPELTSARLRPLAVTGLVIVAAVAGAGWIPAPISTYSEGVVWPAEDAQLRAERAGFLTRLQVGATGNVKAGQVVAVLGNDQLEADAESAFATDERSRRSYLTALAGLDSVRAQAPSRVEVALQQQEWQRARDRLDHAEQERAALVISARREGRLDIARFADLPGRWLAKGDTIGHVLTADAPTIRVVVVQDDIDLVRTRLQGAEVRLAGDPAKRWMAKVVREVPAAGDGLPSAALALEGGGLIPADLRDPEHPRALTRVFQFDLRLPAEAAGCKLGERAYVKFSHGNETVAQQGWRRVRQLLLSRLAM